MICHRLVGEMVRFRVRDPGGVRRRYELLPLHPLASLYIASPRTTPSQPPGGA